MVYSIFCKRFIEIILLWKLDFKCSKNESITGGYAVTITIEISSFSWILFFSCDVGRTRALIRNLLPIDGAMFI